MKVREAYEDYLWAIKRLSPETQRGYKVKLGVLSRWCEEKNIPLEGLDRKTLRMFFAELSTRTKPETQRSYARTIKAFLFWCSREDGFEGLVSDSTPRRMEMPRKETRILEVFTKEDIRLLKKSAEQERNKELQMRGKAIIEVLYGTGIRAAELIGLPLENCTLSPDSSSIKVFGKGQKERVVPLDDSTARTLQTYIKRFRNAREGERHVFLSDRGTPLTVTGLEEIIYRLSDRAGLRLEGRVRCSPHTFRHTYAVVSLLRGLDIYKLKIRMGHSSITVTEGYLHALESITARRAEPLYI